MVAKQLNGKIKRIAGIIILTISVNFFSACIFIETNEHIDIGMEALAEFDYKGALEAFARAEEAGENERLLYRGIGIAQMGLYQYEDALKSFEKALSFSNGIPSQIDFDINYYMATAFFKTDQKAKAIESYNAILTLKDKEGDAYYLRGAIKLLQERLDEACEDFDMALSLSKESSDRLIDIYQILAASGYQVVGEKYLTTAMEEDAKNLNNFEKGRISYYLGDYENAKMFLERARDISYEAVLFLGKTYEVLGDFNYAVSVYSAYLDAGNDSPQIYNQLGLCRMSMNDYEGALKAFLAGMAIPDNEILQTLRFNEIVAYEFLGDFKRAAVLMDGYLRLYPEDETAIRENYFLQSR
ncbi:MAG: tetratricopeptide repeat protein [Lachnospiraceae bacterium]|nr:tetratricopeptide repeat protein [Lachnospiraceae bacterium]